MRSGFGHVMTIVSIAISLSACATPKDKTAPCERPANLASYVTDPQSDCGPMWAVNTDTKSALAMIDDLADQQE